MYYTEYEHLIVLRQIYFEAVLDTSFTPRSGEFDQ